MGNDKTAAAKASELAPSGNDNYARGESERAQADLASRALRYARDCGANFEWPPPGELEAILRSDFWFFVYNAAVHRHTFEGAANRAEDTKKRLSELVKVILPLVELLRNEAHARALGALGFENWIVQRFAQAEPIAGELVAERTRQCLELLVGPLEHAFDRTRSTKAAPSSDRHKLTRWALEQAEGRGGWWPANPTDEDLTVLSILTGVYLQNFEDDFDARQQLAEEAASSSGAASHLDALWRRERRRFSDVRKSVG
jgi:hypothetical protein